MPQHSPAGGLPRRPAPARRKGTALATALRALASCLALLALLAGLPLLLWWGTDIVAGPGIQALGSLLSTQDSGQVFLLALAVAGWIGWGLFAASVVVEIPAQLRGHTAPHLRLLVGQRAAATLVGAILLALPTGTALASSATPAQAATPTATATAHPGANSAQAHAAATAAASASAQNADGTRTISYTVRSARPAESLWSIAHDRLGDGNRWEEIAGLNQGRTMADGTTFHAGDPIQPGWILHLPADATTPGSGTHTDGGHSARSVDTEHTTHYTVRPGDNLSQIAEDELGDATKYPALFQLNEGRPQPHGLPELTDQDLIFPGQHLDIPVAAPPHDSGSGSDTKDNRKSAPPSGQDSTPHDTATPHATESPSTATPTPWASAPATPSLGTTTPDADRTDQPTATATPRPAQSAPAQGPATTPDPTLSPTIQPTLHGTQPAGTPHRGPRSRPRRR